MTDMTETCKQRAADGLPANALLVIPSTRGAAINLVTPKGSASLHLEGDTLTMANGSKLDLNRLVMDELTEAISQVRPTTYETKHGWEIQDGNREGWEYIGNPGSEDENRVNLYRRVMDTGTGSITIWFDRSAIVK